MNDEINALLKSKNAWEKRIVELGGPDYASKIESDEYQYFGAAKNLAEVKQMYEKDMPAAPQENRQRLEALVDDNYLGLDREDDSELGEKM